MAILTYKHPSNKWKEFAAMTSQQGDCNRYREAANASDGHSYLHLGRSLSEGKYATHLRYHVVMSIEGAVRTGNDL